MDAVAKEHTFRINDKVLVISGVPITLIGVKDSLNSFTNSEIIFKILVRNDITATFRSLTQIIEVFLLLKREILPFWNLITHYFQVSELINEVFKLARLRVGLLLAIWCTSS